VNGQRLHDLRDAAGLTQFELAVRAGVRPETISRIESGKTTDPPVRVVTGLASALGCTVDYLLGNGDPADPKVVAG
jgi:transcriptional regulator with XRE-family HTH domain